MDKKSQQLVKKLDQKKVKLDEPLAKYVGLKIGGPADILYFAESTNDLIKVVQLAKQLEVPFVVIGGGTNILIADRGIRGLVIVNRKGEISIKGEVSANEVEDNKDRENLIARWEADGTQGIFRGIEFKDLDYDEHNCAKIEVEMDAGVSLEVALYHLIKKGITGLQWYAGIPGTIGGAVFNNIHGGSHFISEIVESVDVLDSDGVFKTLKISDLGADYDRSRFHKSKEIILRVRFLMYKGDADRAKNVAIEWARRKKIQPRNSPGCTFGNITQEQKVLKGYPTTSIGYLVEFVIHQENLRIGDAGVYKDHHNFIVNYGNATAKDYLEVVKTIYKKTKEITGIILVPEIFFLGFLPEEIVDFESLTHSDIFGLL